jgi:hypothetical protein
MFRPLPLRTAIRAPLLNTPLRANHTDSTPPIFKIWLNHQVSSSPNGRAQGSTLEEHFQSQSLTQIKLQNNQQKRNFTASSTMSSNTFSNADTGSKPADPYTKKAQEGDDVSLQEKVEDLVDFINAAKFGMMTTRQSDTGLLASRAMAVAGKVSISYLITAGCNLEEST